MACIALILQKQVHAPPSCFSLSTVSFIYLYKSTASHCNFPCFRSLPVSFTMEITTDKQGLQNSVEDEEEKVATKLGPKTFHSSVDMFHYLYNLLHHWPPNLNVNKVLNP